MLIVLLVVGIVVATVLAARFAYKKKPKVGSAEEMPRVLHVEPADSAGYHRLYLHKPIGSTQAGALVTATGPAQNPDGTLVEHTYVLHGQREFDVPSGSTVQFPDGTDLHVQLD